SQQIGATPLPSTSVIPSTQNHAHVASGHASGVLSQQNLRSSDGEGLTSIAMDHLNFASTPAELSEQVEVDVENENLQETNAKLDELLETIDDLLGSIKDEIVAEKSKESHNATLDDVVIQKREVKERRSPHGATASTVAIPSQAELKAELDELHQTILNDIKASEREVKERRSPHGATASTVAIHPDAPRKPHGVAISIGPGGPRIPSQSKAFLNSPMPYETPKPTVVNNSIERTDSPPPLPEQPPYFRHTSSTSQADREVRSIGSDRQQPSGIKGLLKSIWQSIVSSISPSRSSEAAGTRNSSPRPEPKPQMGNLTEAVPKLDKPYPRIVTVADLEEHHKVSGRVDLQSDLFSELEARLIESVPSK
ncbi:MAG: hypothetical protein ACR2RE_19200, partial [Geminicoccaceae bacterium]